MTMKTRNHSTRIRTFGRHAAALVAAITAVALASGASTAQSRESTDRDYPVHLTSTEIAGPISPYREIYYTFVAGPGDLVFTLDVLKDPSGGGYAPELTVALFDDDANTIDFEDGFSSRYVYGLGTNDARKIFRAPLQHRQRVLMRLSTSDVREGARFRVRLAGPIELPRPLGR
jgi:hypothetical protein